MRLATIGEPGRERPVVVLDESAAEVSAARPAWPRTWRGILAAGLLPQVESAVREAPRVALDGVRLGPPITDPSKIIAIGLNYRDHALEQKKEPPSAPLLFAKAPTCLVGPRDAIRLPDPVIEDQVDAEAELCAVVGLGGRDIPESRAMDHLAGFTVMNDVSGRRSQYGDKQWFRGKSYDSFGPCGPWIVTREELPDPSGLSLEADWGGRAMQRGNTRDLIFSVPALVAYISRMMTLLPGDLITTGTPAGVGVFREPPLFLRRGEVVSIRLEGVGELHNPVV